MASRLDVGIQPASRREVKIMETRLLFFEMKALGVENPLISQTKAAIYFLSSQHQAAHSEQSTTPGVAP